VIMQMQLFDIPDPEYIHYTCTDRGGQNRASTMAAIRGKTGLVSVSIGGVIVKISDDHASRLLSLLQRGFDRGLSYRKTIQDMIDEAVNH